MPSATLIDRGSPEATAPDVGDLLVLWQHPQSREIVPIGRFSYDGATYSFVYTRAATTIEGFRPLPGLGDLSRPYTSSQLPAVFGQRVMEADRPDYVEYLSTLGLDQERATPWEQIVRSGGTRAGDTLQFMQVPAVREGRAQACFLANGIRHIPETERLINGRRVGVSQHEQNEALRGLTEGDRVLLEAEEGNPKDRAATLITTGGIPVGWAPRAIAPSLRELIASQPVAPTVLRVGEPGTPPHLRLVLDLDVPAPEGFEFDREGNWRPATNQ